MVDEDLGDALKDYNRKQAIEWKNMGNNFFIKEDYENAIQSFKKALEIDPNYIDAWNNLGLAYIKSGNIDEAKKCHEKIDFLKKINIIEPPLKSSSRIDQQSISNSTVKIPTDVSLTENEVPIWSGHMSWASQWLLILIGILLIFTIIGIIISLILFVIAAINVETSEYFISNQRVYMKYGLIRRVVNDLKLEWITNISVSQGFIGRILNYGTVLIATPGTHTGTTPFLGVSDPMKIRGLIDTQIQKYKTN